MTPILLLSPIIAEASFRYQEYLLDSCCHQGDRDSFNHGGPFLSRNEHSDFNIEDGDSVQPLNCVQRVNSACLTPLMDGTQSRHVQVPLLSQLLIVSGCSFISIELTLTERLIPVKESIFVLLLHRTSISALFSYYTYFRSIRIVAVVAQEIQIFTTFSYHELRNFFCRLSRCRSYSVFLLYSPASASLK